MDRLESMRVFVAVAETQGFAPPARRLAMSPPAVTRAVSALEERIVDLIDEGIDVAVRIAHLPDSSLRAVRVGSVRWVVCASPEYLAARGTPRTPADLTQHDTIAFSFSTSPQEWSFASGETLRLPTQLVVNSNDVAIAAAVAGRGVARALSYQIAPELRAGKLQIVLSEFEPPPVPVSVVYVEGWRAAAKVRAFVDFVVERLRSDKSLN